MTVLTNILISHVNKGKSLFFCERNLTANEIHYINSRGISIKRNKLGQQLIFQGLEDNILYKTQIGIGLVDSGEKDFENETTTLKLRYRYNSSEDGDTKILIVFH